ncbi:e7c7de85-27a1-4ff5-b479-e02e431e7c2e [Thermothielavioides terrestris]|uniref:E7c7de85-27a1-4ff5-b479-e02e431e7c2e n=1 Tax=Thermothielavioides terrestris TaxID=2587410 RepID=A0A446B6B8_9PEZI|nr:e7c7de85-27a1-4ff5-b479-e02e431e7c2e [Thermothielavioides terrestris]
MPAPPVLRTQSLGPGYGAATAYASASTGTSARTQQRHDLRLQSRRRAQGVNPLMPLLTQAFQNYRKKQAGKSDQKWPEVLEGPFLDALILVPQMGRKKYTMRQTQYGRNMLIGEYLWIAYCQSLPPGAEPDPQMARGRKMVSSHIQVLRKFFPNHRCFHFFFGQGPDDKDGDSIETASLKNNPVLIALSEGRLPDERPNYEYLAQVLALDEQVQFRPKRCWIFVSHEDVVVGEDRTGHLRATGARLGEAEYPHLGRNLERETWAKEEQQFFKGALLHEFTKELQQVESSSVRELSKQWESAFPALHQRLKAITSTTTDARCDILHMHATLELKEKRRFPSGSNLSSWVEINLEQPRLLNHRWKVETRLVRPPELGCSHDGSAPEVVYEPAKREFTIPYQHRPGCDGRGQCDCLAQRCRREGVVVPFPVPFPAEVWAQTLTNCAEYPAHPFSDSKRHDRERDRAVKAEEDDGEAPRSRRRSKQPTQMDLVPKIAMMQEIWSCPPPSSPLEDGSSGSGSQRWTRRAVILWTFATIHRIDDGKLITAPGGKTDWRFLTILDPASEYHQRRAIISGRRSSAEEYQESSSSNTGASRPASRDAIVSPRPTYQPHLSASMSENFSAAWDSAAGLGSLTGPAPQAAYGAHFMSQTIPSHGTAAQGGYGLLDSFSSHSGLATPPPSASLASSFAQTFDTASTSSDIVPSYMATTAGIDAGSHALGDTLSVATDPFLAHVGVTYGETHDGIHGWPGHAGGLDPSHHAWPSAYPGVSAAHAHSETMSWAGSQPPSTSSRRGSEQQQQQQQHSYHYQTYQTHPERPQQPWTCSSTTNTATSDDHDPWTPLTSSTHTPGEAAATITTTAANASTNIGNNTTTTITTAAAQEPSQDCWAQLGAPPAPSTTITTGSSGNGSDRSREWEDIDMTPLPGTGAGATVEDEGCSAASPALDRHQQQHNHLQHQHHDGAHAHHYHHHHHHHQQQQQQQHLPQHNHNHFGVDVEASMLGGGGSSRGGGAETFPAPRGAEGTAGGLKRARAESDDDDDDDDDGNNGAVVGGGFEDGDEDEEELD